MDRFFMQRASAVLYLLHRRREWSTRIESAQTGDAQFEMQQLAVIERLILDVSAGRVHAFELDHPKAVAVFVSD
jgi:hypothetical protein